MAQTKSTSLQIREKTIFDGVFFKFILKFIFKFLFKILGWTSGPTPKVTGVVIGVPHTSNWDFLFGMGAAIIEDSKVYFSIKQSWCQMRVIGPIILWLGGIPIDRSGKGQGQVEQISRFAQKMKDRCIYFAFTPEGTRSKVEKWKTGFYHMAYDNQLPLHLAKLDYENKVAGIFHTYQVTDDKEQDIAILQHAYQLIRGKNPEKQFPSYTGSVPELDEAEVKLMHELYLHERSAGPHSVSPINNQDQATKPIIKKLLELGLIEAKGNITDGVYQLTLEGKGCLLNVLPSL